MKNILMPTDFSISSINAIHYTLEFFKNEEYKFYLLNVQKASSFISDDMMSVNTSTTVYRTIIDEAKKSIENIVLSIKKKYSNEKHKFCTIVDYDNFIDSINQVCQNNNIHLICMGTKGASGLEKVLFGSNTVRVMQRCSTPVLAIPDGCSYVKPEKIAFATTNSKLFKPENLTILKDFLENNNALLQILHLADQNHLVYDAYDNLDFLNKTFNESKHEFIDAPSHEMYEVVHDFIKQNHIHILAIMNKKHSFLERLFTTHAVERFAFKIDIPLLVLQYD